MSYTEKELKIMADLLWEAADKRRPVKPLTDSFGMLTVEEAYKVQLFNTERLKTEGHSIIGKKIGLTSKAIQESFGVKEPDYGQLTDQMLIPQGAAIKTLNLIQPKIEAELAFVLADKLQGPGVTKADVLRNTAGVMASLEIVDSRVEHWRIKLEDTIADNASSAAFILGSKMVRIDNIDLRTVGLVLEKNGEVIYTASGAAVLGNPAEAVAWLANKLSEFDYPLEKGEIILSGSFTAACNAKPGDVFLASFSNFGEIAAKFI